MTWRPAPCITTMLQEANALAPHRNKASDGIVGDPSHAATESDHNPDSRGIVHAIDLTQDPNGGWDCDKRVAEIVAAKDRRIKYIIWDRHMWRSYDKPGIPAWSKAPYSGASPHTDHMHVSVLSGDSFENDVHPWFGPAEEDFLAKLTEAEQHELLTKVRAIFAVTENEVKRVDGSLTLYQAVTEKRDNDPHAYNALSTLKAMVQKVIDKVGA